METQGKSPPPIPQIPRNPRIPERDQEPKALFKNRSLYRAGILGMDPKTHREAAEWDGGGWRGGNGSRIHREAAAGGDVDGWDRAPSGSRDATAAPTRIPSQIPAFFPLFRPRGKRRKPPALPRKKVQEDFSHGTGPPRGIAERSREFPGIAGMPGFTGGGRGVPGSRPP